jgi:hypothetical protein
MVVRCARVLVLALLLRSIAPANGDEKRFVGKFSNGVEVEFVGVGMNPSAKADWWRPDGSPLAERPYARVFAQVGGATAREICWRWAGVGDADVETHWHTEPAYVGAGGYAADEKGKQIEHLEASAIAFDTVHKTCTVQFTITLPVSPWVTTIETQAGYAASTSQMDAAIGRVGAAFLPSRSDGPDTVVTLAYEIPGREVRLVGIDNQDREHVAERATGAGISGMLLGEYRFKNVIRTELKIWRLQTRIRRPQTVEFHNVSLEPGHKTEVQVVDADDKTISFVEAQPPTGTSVDADSPENAANERYKRQQELVKALSEKHGYKLAEGEPFKYIRDPQIAERDKFHASITDAMSLGEWMSQPSDAKPKFEPYMLLFRQQDDGTLACQSSHEGITTLAEVLANVLKLRRHEIDCPPNLFLTYMPGDWVLPWNPNEAHKWSDEELAAFEKILNDEFNLAIRVNWKTEKRPALVISGEYKAAPKVAEEMSPQVAERADGMFEIPARRSNISASVGRPDEFLQAIGEVLMLPVVNEPKTHPAKESFFWRYTEDQPVVGHERLDSKREQRVLESLHEQLGYDFTIEPREVRLLSIQPVED